MQILDWVTYLAIVIQSENIVVEEAGTTSSADNNHPGGNAIINPMSSYEFLLSCILLVFGLIIISAQFYVFTRKRADEGQKLSGETGMRLSIVSLIIVSSLVLIASGYNSIQVAPVMGLFGTIAGYLLGRQDKSS